MTDLLVIAEDDGGCRVFPTSSRARGCMAGFGKNRKGGYLFTSSAEKFIDDGWPSGYVVVLGQEAPASDTVLAALREVRDHLHLERPSSAGEWSYSDLDEWEDLTRIIDDALAGVEDAS